MLWVLFSSLQTEKWKEQGKIIHRGAKERGRSGDKDEGLKKKKKKQIFFFFFKHQKDYDTGKIVPSENPLKDTV